MNHWTDPFRRALGEFRVKSVKTLAVGYGFTPLVDITWYTDILMRR